MAPPAGRQEGYTLAIVLLLMLILASVGSVSLLKVRGDTRHTTRDVLQTKAKGVAESAVHWAIAGLAQSRPGVLPYTAATHANDGVQRLPDRLANGEVNPRKLHTWDVAAPYGGTVREDAQGWIYQTTSQPDVSLTRSNAETIAFRIWYPDDATVRITGRGTVQGVSAQVEMTGSLSYRRIGH